MIVSGQKTKALCWWDLAIGNQKFTVKTNDKVIYMWVILSSSCISILNKGIINSNTQCNNRICYHDYGAVFSITNNNYIFCTIMLPAVDDIIFSWYFFLLWNNYSRIWRKGTDWALTELWCNLEIDSMPFCETIKCEINFQYFMCCLIN